MSVNLFKRERVLLRRIEIASAKVSRSFRKILCLTIEKLQRKPWFPNINLFGVDLENATTVSKVYHHIKNAVMSFKRDSEKFLVTFTPLFKNGGVVDGLCVFGNHLVSK